MANGVPSTAHFSVLMDTPSGLMPAMPPASSTPEERILKLSTPTAKPVAQPGEPWSELEAYFKFS
jgi:hypothetical protein